MKRVFHKTIAFVMAFVVVLATMSFTINKHYCGDILIETGLFQKAQDCGMSAGKPLSENDSILSKKCCNDQQSVVDGQDALQVVIDQISIDYQGVVGSLFCVCNLFEGFNKSLSVLKSDKLLRVKKIFKLDETYLI